MWALHDGFSSVNFVVDMTRCRDVLRFLAYFYGADFYTRLLLNDSPSNDMNSFEKFVFKKKIRYIYIYIAISIIVQKPTNKL